MTRGAAGGVAADLTSPWRARPLRAACLIIMDSLGVSETVLAALPTRDVAHVGAWVGFWSAAGVVNARSETARVLGRWVEGLRAVCHRLRVVCVLVWRLGRAPE